MRAILILLAVVALPVLSGGCMLWPFGDDENEPRKRTVLFGGGEEIEVEEGGVCTWDGRSYKAHTRVCKDNTFRECLPDGRWRLTGTC